MSKYKVLFLFLLVTLLSRAYGQAPVIIPKPPQINLPLDAAGHYTVTVEDIAAVTNSTDSITRYRYYPKEFTCDDRGPQKVNLTASTNGSAGNPTPGNVSFRSMSDLAFDLSGNLFVLESGSHLIRKITPQGDVSIYAGTGGSGYKDGPAATALFAEPAGIACDSLGNLYISETGNNVIRKISTDGIVSTYAGTGDAGAYDGKADKAQFNFPNKLALDRNNNLYVSEFGNFKIRKISPDGMVTTIAGNGSSGYLDDKGKDAIFAFPAGLAIDSHGNIFVCDVNNRRIRKITPDGTVTTYAGTGQSALADGPALSASFMSPDGIVIDNADNLFITDAFAIRMITPAGMVSTLAGSDHPGNADGIGAAAGFDFIQGICVDLCDNLYVGGVFEIRKIELSGKVSTYAGDGAQHVVNGNIGPSTCQSSVAVIPVNVQSKPAITSVFNDVTIDDCARLPDYTLHATATDNCPDAIIKFTQSPAPGTALTDNTPTDVTIIAADETGGTGTASFKVTATNTASAPGRSVSVTATTQKICTGSPVTFRADLVNGLAGVSYQWLINGQSTGPNAPEFTSTTLKNGDVVNCAVTTASGCAIPNLGQPISMSVNDYPTISLNIKEHILAGNSIRLNPVITGDIMTYIWTPAVGLSNANVQSPVASPATTTNYHLKITTTAGCDADADVTVMVVTEVKIPNAFTPNGDGINDLWNIDALLDYPDCMVNIFNRYGQLLYKSTGYAKAWNGTYLGKTLPAGAYYYVIDLKDGAKPRSGEVSIIR